MPFTGLSERHYRFAGFCFFCNRFVPALRHCQPPVPHPMSDNRRTMSSSPPPFAPCPCGRLSPPAPYKEGGKLLALANCCGRYLDHFGSTPAPDAEHLMRSRYSAFVLQRRDYLLATWHASTRPGLLDFEPEARWLGLEVRRHRLLGADHAEVEFVARYRVAGRAVRLHEHSQFVREGKRWFYVQANS